MIRAVLFDLDGTLYDRDAAILRTAEEQFEMFREEFDVDKSVFIERLVALDGHGHGRAPHFHHALGKALGFSADLAERLEACFRSRYPDHCRISGGSLNTLETLRTGGKRLGIITNGPTEWQSRKIECMGIAPLFDTILISETEGIQKPRREWSKNVSFQELDQAMGSKLPRADLHISRSRDGELLLTSRQDGIIRMLVP